MGDNTNMWWSSLQNTLIIHIEFTHTDTQSICVVKIFMDFEATRNPRSHHHLESRQSYKGLSLPKVSRLGNISKLMGNKNRKNHRK